MLRTFLIDLSQAAWAQDMVTKWPIARRAASRFVAGQTVDDALRVVTMLNGKGINATLDQLGEHTTKSVEANRAADGILAVLDQVQKAGVRANVSIKLTQIGLGLDEHICRANLMRILERARDAHNFVRIDIEDSPYTDRTIALYTEMLERGFTGESLGTAVQSYLFRAEADARALVARGARLRVVKGAYQEPPDVAFVHKPDVDASYDTLVSILIDASLAHNSALSADGRVPPIPAVATHDETRIAFARSYAEKVGLPKSGLEFQMLYGIRRDLQEELVRAGYPVRVYVPFGTHWYPYFMRRLAERPENIWFFLSNSLKK
jgi:proline dehydrogenase